MIENFIAATKTKGVNMTETEEPNTEDIDDSVPVTMKLGNLKLSVRWCHVPVVIKFIQDHMEKCPNLKANRCVTFAFEKAIELNAIEIGDTSIWDHVDYKHESTIKNDDENTDGNIVVMEEDNSINDPTEF